jgi:hypothetical protein
MTQMTLENVEPVLISAVNADKISETLASIGYTWDTRELPLVSFICNIGDIKEDNSNFNIINLSFLLIVDTAVWYNLLEFDQLKVVKLNEDKGKISGFIYAGLNDWRQVLSKGSDIKEVRIILNRIFNIFYNCPLKPCFDNYIQDGYTDGTFKLRKKK